MFASLRRERCVRQAEYPPVSSSKSKNTVTTVGPAELSMRRDNSRPNKQPTAPKIHPNKIRRRAVEAIKTAAKDGTIQKANTSNTPVSFTAKVTTIPKVM